MLLGVPVGEVDAARAVLIESVKDDVAAVDKLCTLNSPMAQMAILQHSGLRSRVEWILAAAPARVVDGTVLDMIAVAEAKHVRSLFGKFAGRVRDHVVTQAQLPTCTGGFGLTSVEWAGRVTASGQWCLRDDDGRKTWCAESIAKMMAKFATDSDVDRTEKRRWYDHRSEHALTWLSAEPGSWVDVDRNPEVEAVMLAMMMGVPLLTDEQQGAWCPADHGRSQEKIGNLHALYCRSAVVNQRHGALQSAVHEALSKRFPQGYVTKEQMVGTGAFPIPRKYGAGGRGESAPGDVVLTVPGRAPVYFDTVVRTGCAPDMWNRIPLTADYGYDQKIKLLEKADGNLAARIVFRPIAMAHWGVMCPRSFKYLLHAGLSKYDVQRVVGDSMFGAALVIRDYLERIRV